MEVTVIEYNQLQFGCTGVCNSIVIAMLQIPNVITEAAVIGFLDCVNSLFWNILCNMFVRTLPRGYRGRKSRYFAWRMKR